MKDRPIIMSGPMVRALLAGTKTQTRRVIKPQPDYRGPRGCMDDPTCWGWESEGGQHIGIVPPPPGDTSYDQHYQPLYQRGDRLYVRETWGVGTRPDPIQGWRDGIEYRADEAYLQGEWDDLPLRSVVTPDGVCLGDYEQRWRPSIHMPRWASRITLTVEHVKIERVQDISGDDCIAEGAWPSDKRELGKSGEAIKAFCALWGSLNAGRGYGWDANPWVVAVTFAVHLRNIDDPEAA